MITRTSSLKPPSVPLRWATILAAMSLAVALLGFAGTARADTGFVAPTYPISVQAASSGTETFATIDGYYKCGPGSSAVFGGSSLTGPAKAVSTGPMEWPSSCVGPFSTSVNIKANGCNFEVDPGAPIGESSEFEGKVAIGPAGCGPITIDSPPGYCDTEVPSQTGIDADMENSGTGPESRVLVDVSGSLSYTRVCNKTKYTGGGFAAHWELDGVSPEGIGGKLSISTDYEVAPSARTGGASGVNATEATMLGTVDPNVLATTYQFEYGTTTAYGSKAPVSPGSAGAGSNDVAVSQGVSGLSSSTLYHYRLVATNSKGTRYGMDRTFETVASGATPAALSWGAGTTQVTAVQTGGDHIFTVPAGTVKCSEASGLDSVVGTTASSLALESLSYHDKGTANCRGPFGTTLVPTISSCSWSFHTGALIGASESTGSMSLDGCAGEGAISFKAYGCAIYLPGNQNIGPVTYKSVGEKVEVDIAATNVTYTSTGFLCGVTTTNTGKYTGKFLLSGNSGAISIE